MRRRDPVYNSILLYLLCGVLQREEQRQSACDKVTCCIEREVDHTSPPTQHTPLPPPIAGCQMWWISVAKIKSSHLGVATTPSFLLLLLLPVHSNSFSVFVHNCVVWCFFVWCDVVCSVLCGVFFVCVVLYCVVLCGGGCCGVVFYCDPHQIGF